ncbi:unnamed protein product, partial [Pylaiella littoralis]
VLEAGFKTAREEIALHYLCCIINHVEEELYNFFVEERKNAIAIKLEYPSQKISDCKTARESPVLHCRVVGEQGLDPSEKTQPFPRLGACRPPQHLPVQLGGDCS